MSVCVGFAHLYHRDWGTSICLNERVVCCVFALRLTALLVGHTPLTSGAGEGGAGEGGGALDRKHSSGLY